MSYEQANEWFKREHEALHRGIYVQLAAQWCLRMDCGRLWSQILHAYQAWPG